MVIEFNKEECGKFFDLKYKDGDIIEIRAIDLTQVEPPNKAQPPIIKYVRSKKEYVETCENINANDLFQVYSGNNPRHKEGGDALSVKSISHIVLDCDPIRPEEFEKKAATQEEIDICEKEVDRIIEHSLKIKLSKPTKIFTGNGFALDWKIPIIEITDKNRDEVTNKIKNFVKEMQKNYNCETTIKIDQTGDLPRIYKPAGVMSKKGDDTKDRPFRMAKFCGDISEGEDKFLLDYIMKLSPIFENITEVGDKETSGKKDESRSARDYREVCKLVGQGKTKEEVYKEMVAFVKWTSSTEAYRTKTYDNAAKYIKSQQKKEENEKTGNNNGLTELDLPKGGKLISKFAEEFVNEIKGKDCLFFRPASRDIVEISKIKDEDEGKEYTGFAVVKPNRLITLVEKHVIPGYTIWNDTKKRYEFNKNSMKNNVSCVVLESQILQEGVPMIERIFQVPIPIMYNGELTFPKRGYDKRFNSWMPFLAPTISNPEMPIEEAKEILESMYKEFCFKDNQDHINSIAGLLTPFLKGLYSRFNIRSPLFFYRGNRPRCGKDYNAGITGITYEGEAIEEPPISSGERNGNNSAETLKKITSCHKRGGTRFHSSNNKGFINDASLESALTNAYHSDRLLGGNETIRASNEVCFSMSGNMGTTMSSDLANRCVSVNLFFDVEDANSRTFDRPDLHGWVRENRSLILSALYSLVRNWIDKDSPDGSVPFSSYPEWAKICGGIMETAEIGNPCIKSDNAFLLATDTEEQDMKTFFELMFEACEEKWISPAEIKMLIKENTDNPFSYLDFNQRSDQTKFGKIIDRFVGRIFSDIKLFCVKDSSKNSRNKYKFSREKRTYKNQLEKSQGKSVNLSTSGNLVPSEPQFSTFDTNKETKQVDNVEEVDKVDIFVEPNQSLVTLKNCPKCKSDEITTYENGSIYCKKCRENYNTK